LLPAKEAPDGLASNARDFSLVEPVSRWFSSSICTNLAPAAKSSLEFYWVIFNNFTIAKLTFYIGTPNDSSSKKPERKEKRSAPFGMDRNIFSHRVSVSLRKSLRSA
jgi:hypothetical protein